LTTLSIASLYGGVGELLALRHLERDRVRAVRLLGEVVAERVGRLLAVGAGQHEVVARLLAHPARERGERDDDHQPHEQHRHAPARTEAAEPIQERVNRCSGT
jgi:hypothetical protein